MKKLLLLGLMGMTALASTAMADSCTDINLKGSLQVVPIDGSGTVVGSQPWITGVLQLKVNELRGDVNADGSVAFNLINSNEFSPSYGQVIETYAKVTFDQKLFRCEIAITRDNVQKTYKVSSRTSRGDLVLEDVNGPSGEPAMVIQKLKDQQ
jgi:hypothetical protein